MRAPAWRWGLASRRPQPFSASRTPRSRQGDSWPANWWALAMALVARRMVAMLAPALARAAKYRARVRGSAGRDVRPHLVTPAGEDAPLGAVDAAGVVGEDSLQCVGHALVGGPQGRRSGGLAGDDLGVGGGGHGRVSGGGIARADFGRLKMRDN